MYAVARALSHARTQHAPCAHLLHTSATRAYSTRVPHLTLFTGPQCSLCDDAKEALAEVRESVPFTFATYNIRDDASPQVAYWRRKYQYDIPVLHVRWDDGPGYGDGFGAPIWRNTILLLAAGAAGYQYYSSLPASDDKPYLTRYIENLLTPASESRAVSDAHIEDALRKAEARLLIQDAQRPAAVPYSFTHGVEQYPRRGMPVGAQFDISAK
ncbi:hypothetical protein MCUN1_003442 [Malassezia cuniculi]|uniref:Glutaredoxin-like protein n=1 Tax=Malassezia cuniculi TaxID=948313 RepID=A0AAF0EY20_9BASI|nr:hypothetical protein MCUN1_003442 [Malassezia cuniculi]